jgi:hypothetical protein
LITLSQFLREKIDLTAHHRDRRLLNNICT